MKLFSGVLRAAISRSAVATSASLFAAGICSGAARRMLAGTVSWISASRDPWPTTRSISVTSDASGPMWRSAKVCVRCDPDMTAPPRCPAVHLPESIPATQQAFASSSVGALRGSLHSTLSSVPIPARSICLRGSGPLLRRRRSCDQSDPITPRSLPRGSLEGSALILPPNRSALKPQSHLSRTAIHDPPGTDPGFAVGRHLARREGDEDVERVWVARNGGVGG